MAAEPAGHSAEQHPPLSFTRSTSHDCDCVTACSVVRDPSTRVSGELGCLDDRGAVVSSVECVV
jgi:hypothetical protein